MVTSTNYKKYKKTRRGKKKGSTERNNMARTSLSMDAIQLEALDRLTSLAAGRFNVHRTTSQHGSELDPESVGSEDL
eukprot:3615633-Amphidinium_carterae.1